MYENFALKELFARLGEGGGLVTRSHSHSLDVGLSLGKSAGLFEQIYG